MKTTSHWFTKKTPRKVTALKAGAPQWLRDAVSAAHDGSLPNDWTYSMCLAACEAWDDFAREPAGEVDGLVDIYNGDRIAWLADCYGTSFYATAEAAAKELASGPADIVYMIGMVQYCAINAIFGIMFAALEENAP